MNLAAATDMTFADRVARALVNCDPDKGLVLSPRDIELGPAHLPPTERVFHSIATAAAPVQPRTLIAAYDEDLGERTIRNALNSLLKTGRIDHAGRVKSHRYYATGRDFRPAHRRSPTMLPWSIPGPLEPADCPSRMPAPLPGTTLGPPSPGLVCHSCQRSAVA